MTLLFAILLAQAAQHGKVSPGCRELFNRVAEPQGALGEAVRACRGGSRNA